MTYRLVRFLALFTATYFVAGCNVTLNGDYDLPPAADPVALDDCDLISIEDEILRPNGDIAYRLVGLPEYRIRILHTDLHFISETTPGEPLQTWVRRPYYGNTAPTPIAVTLPENGENLSTGAHRCIRMEVDIIIQYGGGSSRRCKLSAPLSWTSVCD